MLLPLLPSVEEYLRSVEGMYLSSERQVLLAPLRDYLVACLRRRQAAPKLVFICTHNSRRSHFAQVWAQVAAHRLGVGPVECFSGGTEVTACNLRTLAALQRAGLPHVAITKGENPIYLVRYAEGVGPIVAFSKHYADPPNPTEDFAAVMTCAQADANCPFIPGLSYRFALTYEDPKAADSTPEEQAAYDACCRQVASEMLHLFQGVRAAL